MALEHCRVILVETHYPRQPRPRDGPRHVQHGAAPSRAGFPLADRADKNARQMSTHGESILNNAHIVTNLSEAINDCVLIVGASAAAACFAARRSASPTP